MTKMTFGFLSLPPSSIVKFKWCEWCTRWEKLGNYLSVPVRMRAGDISSQEWRALCTTQVLRGGLARSTSCFPPLLEPIVGRWYQIVEWSDRRKFNHGDQLSIWCWYVLRLFEYNIRLSSYYYILAIQIRLTLFPRSYIRRQSRSIVPLLGLF